eukprot:scaffold298466_cov18-Tisochrysis_lutea.AAC.1
MAVCQMQQKHLWVVPRRPDLATFSTPLVLRGWGHSACVPRVPHSSPCPTAGPLIRNPPQSMYCLPGPACWSTLMASVMDTQSAFPGSTKAHGQTLGLGVHYVDIIDVALGWKDELLGDGW